MALSSVINCFFFFFYQKPSCRYSAWLSAIFIHFACIDFWGQHCHSNDTFCNHGDTFLGNASAFLRLSAWYMSAMSNSKQGRCRHQAGVETPLARNHLTCTPVSNPTQELHTERQAPKQSPVEKCAVDTILLHSPAVSFPPARMMPMKLM